LNSKNLNTTNNLTNIRNGIWLYFLLLIFEGAIRKWLLPQLANPILLVRDPLVIYLLISASFNRIVFLNSYLFYTFCICIISFMATMFVGHGNIFVAIYGLRIFLLHFPMIFLIGTVFNKEDVIKMGKVVLYFSIPMAILIVIQFFSPQSAWVNKGIGDSIGGGFSGAMGYLRPPGTFSFTSGITSFFSLVAVFVFYFWIESPKINRVILSFATIALLASIPFSISRSLFFQILIISAFGIIGSNRIKLYNNKIAIMGLGIGILITILSLFDIFLIGVEAFSNRLEKANTSEGGFESVFLDRYLGGLINALSSSSYQPFWGYGIGYGTNVGSNILTNKSTFLISEGEWGRLIGELGPILGLGIILIRLLMSIRLTSWAWHYLKINDILPWLILSFTLLILPQGGWSQPTSLGFSVLVTGLLIASFKSNNLTENSIEKR
jgi:hypothetical protein